MVKNLTSAGNLNSIQRFVVLMLENRSFDHLFGYLRSVDARVAGLTGNETNRENPHNPQGGSTKVFRADSFAMTFDPGHGFHDVQMQLYGPMSAADPSLPPIARNPTSPAPMSGFIFSAIQTATLLGDESLVMGCYQPDQLPVLSTLAREFALFNFWYSSLPGPAWPNRFFVHAATSGGLMDSPEAEQILEGFSFTNGTIFKRLTDAGKEWRVYNDGLPQTAVIAELRSEYVDPFTRRFDDFSNFARDVQQHALPEYTFIEPDHNTGNNIAGGNSMHPLNDLRKGEELVKFVYETLRNSDYWQDTMFIITFDGHGGFYDHQSPPATTATGDDTAYANGANSFKFEQLGVRVPAIAISAYTQKGTVVGSDPSDSSTVFDHSSIVATIAKKFGLPPLTKRDAAANTLECVINLTVPRDDAPTRLPNSAPDSAVTVPKPRTPPASAKVPASENQKAISALALACHLKVTDSSGHAALIHQYQNLKDAKEIAKYIQQVEQIISERRK